MKRLNKGDKVELFFGGPIMVVSEQNSSWSQSSQLIAKQNEVLCQWNFNGEQIKQKFARALLNKL